MTEPRSQKQQRAQLVQLLRVAGHSWVEIARVLQQRYRLNARVAFRYAHGWSQRQVGDEWNRRWPDELRTFKNFSYWELWPSSTGHAPSFDTLSKLAQLYQCAVSDLLVDLPNFRHLDAVIGNRDLRELLGYADSADVPDEVRLILDRADATPETDHDVAPPGDDVNRRGFTGMTVGLVASTAMPYLPVPTRVDAGHVRSLQAAVEQLSIQDQSRGGGSNCRPFSG